MKDNVLQFQHDRAGLIAQARALLDSATSENRDLTSEEEKRYNDLVSDADKILGKIEREKTLQFAESSIDQQQRAPVRSTPVTAGQAAIGMSISDMQSYSLVRAIRAMVSGDWRGAQLEKEASEATAKRLGITPQGLLVPYDWMARTEQRDLTKGTATAGGHTVDTELLSNSFIDMLMAQMVLKQAGITTLDGLVGDLAIPRQTGGATAYWVAESSAVTESQQAFDQVLMSPKTLGTFTDISRKLLKQSSISIERFVRKDLTRTVAKEIDRVGLFGSGASNQPTGVSATSGINLVPGGDNGLAPTWANLVGLESAVAADNADVGNLAYITNSSVRGKLKTVEITANSGQFLWGSGNSVNGYPIYVSNQVPNNNTKGSGTALSYAFFGNWSDLMLGLWGGLDLLVDPYTGGTAGTVRIIVLQDVDYAVRHPESFAMTNDIITV